MSRFVGYHASTRRLDVPVQFRDPRGMDYGPGLYFATDALDTTSFGPWVHRAEVRLDKPVLFSASNIDEGLVKKLQRAFRIGDDDLLGEQHPLVEIMGLVNAMIEIVSYTPARLRNFLAKLGYDGIYVENSILAASAAESGLSPPRGDYFAIFDPAQILSWEAVDTMKKNRRSSRRSSRRKR
jgi:hypothetical protein